MDKRLEVFKLMLSTKLVFRVDITEDKKNNRKVFSILCIDAEKKYMIPTFVKVDNGDKESLEEVKRILIERFDIGIKGFENFKKVIKDVS